MQSALRAAVDIGSNTIRLLIGRVAAGKVLVERQALITTRLGSTRVGDKLSPVGRAKTIEALQEFAGLMTQAGVAAAPIVAATSAVREAADGQDFAAEVWDKLGWRLEILSGEQEAACSYAGAASAGNFGEGAAPAVIDVGGGSTELICRQRDGAIKGRSVKVGAVRLYNGEVSAGELPQMLSELLEVLPDRGPRPYISVGGTITLVAALLAGIESYDREAVSGRMVTVRELRELNDSFLAISPKERLAQYPMLAGREDIITAGLTIYLELARLLGAEGFTASDAGLLDGLLLKQAGL